MRKILLNKKNLKTMRFEVFESYDRLEITPALKLQS